MLIVFDGKNCTDGCPFYSMRFKKNQDRIYSFSPECGLDGKNTLSIKLRMSGSTVDGEVLSVCVPPKECPFEDVHGLPVEVLRK